MIGRLPRSLDVNGTEYRIRTDYRDILNVLVAFADPELSSGEKIYVCLVVLYEDFENIPPEDYEEAYKQASSFIDCGREPDEKQSPRVMDWEQDEQLIFPAINKVAGMEVRSCDYVHWWTFMGWFLEISEGTFSQVISLRQKKAKGKKLEKWEQQFWSDNKKICTLRPKLTEEEQAAKDRLNALLG